MFRVMSGSPIEGTFSRQLLLLAIGPDAKSNPPILMHPSYFIFFAFCTLISYCAIEVSGIPGLFWEKLLYGAMLPTAALSAAIGYQGLRWLNAYVSRGFRH